MWGLIWERNPCCPPLCCAGAFQLIFKDKPGERLFIPHCAAQLARLTHFPRPQSLTDGRAGVRGWLCEFRSPASLLPFSMRGFSPLEGEVESQNPQHHSHMFSESLLSPLILPSGPMHISQRSKPERGMQWARALQQGGRGDWVSEPQSSVQAPSLLGAPANTRFLPASFLLPAWITLSWPGPPGGIPAPSR